MRTVPPAWGYAQTQRSADQDREGSALEAGFRDTCTPGSASEVEPASIRSLMLARSKQGRGLCGRAWCAAHWLAQPQKVNSGLSANRIRLRSCEGQRIKSRSEEDQK